MKNLISYLLLFYTSFVVSQQKSVYVEYGVIIYNEEKMFSEYEPLRVLMQRAIDNAPNLSFGLIINKTASKFYDKSNLAANDADYSYRGNLAFANYTGVSYQFPDAFFYSSSNMGSDILITKELTKDWVLTNETKMIDNYLCYKATNINRIEHKDLNKVFNHPVIAWYCPKLPYAFGPNTYGNLPGLILELQVRNVVYGVKKIDLNSDLTFDTAFLAKKTIITEEELNSRLQQDAENWGK